MTIGKLFFYILHPHLFILKEIVKYRRNKAIKKAIKLSTQIPNKNIFVFQIGSHFKVGTREELHRYNKNGRKNLHGLTKTSSLDFNCKYSIIYTARNGIKQMG